MIYTPEQFPPLDSPEPPRTKTQQAAHLLERLAGAIRLQSPNQEPLVREILALVDGQKTREDGTLYIEWNLWGRVFRARGTIPARESIKPASLVAFAGALVNDLMRAMDDYAQNLRPD